MRIGTLARLSGVLLILLGSCRGQHAVDRPVDEATAAAIFHAVFTAVTGEFAAVGTSPTYPDYTSPDGTLVVHGEYTVYPYHFEFAFTFRGYTAGDGTKIDGTVTYVDEVDDSTGVHSLIYQDGAFDVLYGGELYSMEWEFRESFAGGGVTYSGTFTVSGNVFAYSGS